jgi:hypothetical protein
MGCGEILVKRDEEWVVEAVPGSQAATENTY